MPSLALVWGTKQGTVLPTSPVDQDGMLQTIARTWGLTLLLGVLGGLLGFGIDLAFGTAGWSVVGASMGLCGGAVYAGALATPAPPSPPTLPAAAE